jgi:uncharacterized heparinase superfamily protein
MIYTCIYTHIFTKVAGAYQFGDITKGVLSMFSSSASSSPTTTTTSSSSTTTTTTTAAQGEALAEGERREREEEERRGREEASAVHVGFLRGYISVRERLVQMVNVLKKEEAKILKSPL